jgi:hypothetical protein
MNDEATAEAMAAEAPRNRTRRIEIAEAGTRRAAVLAVLSFSR